MTLTWRLLTGLFRNEYKGNQRLGLVTEILFHISIPLVAATVFFPLIALSVFRFVVRKVTSGRNLLKWIWILCTFILYITADSGSHSSDLTVATNCGFLYTTVSSMNLAIASIEAFLDCVIKNQCRYTDILGDILVGPVSGLLRPPPCLLDYSCKSGLNFFHMSFFLHYTISMVEK
jgi:hypothetical protein